MDRHIFSAGHSQPKQPSPRHLTTQAEQLPGPVFPRVWGRHRSARVALAFGSLLILVALVTAPPTRAEMSYYTIVDVGPMPPYHSETYATGINASAQVVGFASGEFSRQGAFLWTPGATNGIPENPQMRDLGNFYGGDYWASAHAKGLNNKGQVVGYATVDAFGWAVAHAFVWKKGRMVDLGTLAEGLYLESVANNINDAGVVVGWSDTDGTKLNRNRHAFIYNTVTKRMLDLGTDHSYGQSINIHNQVVGSYFKKGLEHAWFWDPDNGPSDLHPRVSCGGNQSGAAAINDRSQVVGWCKDRDGVEHAFFLDLKTGKVRHLDSPQATMAMALNDHGMVVGNFKYTPQLDHAFIWKPGTGTMEDLNDRIPYNSGWTLYYAWGINDDGQIAGYGAHETDFAYSRGFVMTPDPHPVLVSLKATPTRVAPAGRITVRWTAPSDHAAGDWVALSEVGALEGMFSSWQYTGEGTSGRLEFTAPTTPGRYEFRYFADDTYRKVATSNVVEVR